MTAAMTPPSARFAPLPPERPADELERELLARWDQEQLFAQSLARRAGAPPFVFFEGPPTANGKPGIHHVFARTIKDLFCRYKVMKGFRVARKAGWDTHGLPVEIEVEKALGISGKQQIEALGVAEFNRRCRESVFTYRDDWQKLSARIAYWLDYDHPYVTFHNEYVESVWWALATLFERELLYRGQRTVPYCPRCSTALSSHELALGYDEADDPSVYLALELADAPGRRILVWTTTPWTLLSNTALAVKADLEYVEVVKRRGDDKRTLILAEARLGGVLGEDWDSRWDVVARFTGDALVGKTYRRPLDWIEFPAEGARWIILAEDFVSAGDGSGVVHLSPAFGADDFAAGKRHNLAFVQPVGTRGEFGPGVPHVGGLFVKDADPIIIQQLERLGVLWKSGRIKHQYPFCWRCDTPLLYMVRSSWFVRTTAYKDAMLARNARVNWQPPHTGSGRFGEWLVNNIDWTISRDRYWGTPLPLWVCDGDASHVEAVGSFADLAAKSGKPLPRDFDPHKPFIDHYSWRCGQAGCGGTMRRTPEVIDAWFDSGSMPFAQWHYPFENRERFEAEYPADYIAEGVDQTRGWFYSLLAIATGLGDALPNNGDATSAPYRNVVVNDQVLDKEGRKMSKSRGNIVEPWGVIERHGVDAVRLFFVASSNVWLERKFDEQVISELAGRFLHTLKHVYTGIFAQYANFGWSPSELDPPAAARPVIDRWLLSRLAWLERTVDDAMAAYDATTASRAIIEFVDDDLANWYVRLNRARFWDDDRAAFATLHTALVSVCRLLAPICPFVTDWMHRELTGESVHLADYRLDEARADVSLDAAMHAIRELARLGRAARETAGIKVRQPLSRMICVAPGVPERDLRPLVPLLQAELNVKRVDLASSGDDLVTLEAKANFRALGKKFGSRTPLAAKAVSAFSSDHLRSFLRGEPLVVSVEGESHQLSAEDVTLVRRAVGAFVVQEDAGFFAAIDPAITTELRLEGYARELISRVQRMRKEAGFAVSDRIVLTVAGGQEVQELMRAHGRWIADEVLAVQLVVHETTAADTHETTEATSVDLGGITARVAITRNV